MAFTLSRNFFLPKTDLARETRELQEKPAAELDELTRIYMERGLDEDLARRVATQLTERNALSAHARDELGISEVVAANPVQTAIVSALTFAVGAIVPIIIVLLTPPSPILYSFTLTCVDPELERRAASLRSSLFS